MRWLVGDVQGCVRELEELVEAIRFDPARDELWFLGDLINRGPDSLAVLRLWRDVGGKSLIGNHEIAVILSRDGISSQEFPTLANMLSDSEANEWLATLRDLPLLVHLPTAGDGPDTWIVHAGLDPRWTDLHDVAARLNALPHGDGWLQSDDVGFATQVRCCAPDGSRCRFTGPPEQCPAPYRPWDELYTGATLVVHGHWARRGVYRTRNTLGLDSGCVYGGALTAWCQDEDRIVQVSSRQ